MYTLLDQIIADGKANILEAASPRKGKVYFGDNESFSDALDTLIVLAERAGMTIRFRTAEELSTLADKGCESLQAFMRPANLLDPIAVLDTRRKDRRPRLLLNAWTLIQRDDPDELIVDLAIAIMSACQVMRGVKRPAKKPVELKAIETA